VLNLKNTLCISSYEYDENVELSIYHLISQSLYLIL